MPDELNHSFRLGQCVAALEQIAATCDRTMREIGFSDYRFLCSQIGIQAHQALAAERHAQQAESKAWREEEAEKRAVLSRPDRFEPT